MIKSNKVAVGDLYESEGRGHAKWRVEALIDLPRSLTMVRLALVDGIAKVTVPIEELGFGKGLKRMA